jgi:large subunit ribosomal protein L9
MKVLLLQNIKGLGQKGEIKEVSDGYAQNALFPKSIARQVTQDVLNKHNLAKASKEKKQIKHHEEIKNLFDTLRDSTLVTTEKANDKGSLYKAVGIKEIINIIKKQHGINVSESIFAENYSTKEVGVKKVSMVSLGQTCNFTLEIKGK